MSIVSASPVTGVWKVDPVHSSVVFAVQHCGVSLFRGHFAGVEGTLDSGADSWQLEGSVAAEGVEVPGADLRGQVLGPDFLDAAAHTAIRFESRELRAEGASMRGRGLLGLRGVTRTVDVRGRLSGPSLGLFGDLRLGLELETAIDRRDFGITWNRALPSGMPALGAEVTITAALQLVRS